MATERPDVTSFLAELAATSTRTDGSALSRRHPLNADGQQPRDNPEVGRALDDQFMNVDIPFEPSFPQAYFDYLANEVLPYAAPVTSPRCVAHMSTLVPEVLHPIAELVISLNQNMVKREASGALTLLERQTLGALHKLVFDRSAPFYRANVQDIGSTLGIVTSGSTAANITALWIARNLTLGPRDGFAGIEHEGMAAALRYYGYSRAVVLGSELLHYSIDKAVSVLGVGGDNCIKLPYDTARRLHTGALREALERCASRNELVIAVVGIAGATDCGSIDSLPELARIARHFRVHFHVDAAWGSGLLFSRQHAPQLAGLALADSVTFDAHKQMHLPVASGVVLLRDPSAAKVIEKRAHYMLQEDSGDLGVHSLEGSRPCSALLIHAALRLLGRKGYERMIDQSIRLARGMADLIADHHDLELLAQPQTNIVLYRYIPRFWRPRILDGSLTADEQKAISDINLAIQRAQVRAGDIACSRTSVMYARGTPPVQITALRAVLSNPLTTEADITLLLADQVRLGGDLSSAMASGSAVPQN